MKRMFMKSTGFVLSMMMAVTMGMPYTSVLGAENDQVEITSEPNENYSDEVSPSGYRQPVYKRHGAGNASAKILKRSLPSSFGTTTKPCRTQISGTCWVFGGIGIFEKAVDQAEGTNKDFSEEHMIWELSPQSDGLGWQMSSKNSGGNEWMSSGYFTSQIGPKNESDVPTQTSTGDILRFSDRPSTLNHGTVQYRAKDIQFYSNVDTLTNAGRETIKNVVYSYGAVGTGIYSGSVSGNTFFYGGSDGQDRIGHEVIIVGWDDNYSRDNFSQGVKPQNNGAFLIRNSWGSSVGINGYYWVSYEDTSLAPTYAITDFEQYNSNENLYQLDEYGSYATVGLSQKKTSFINVMNFNKGNIANNQYDKIKSLTFYSETPGVKYQMFFAPLKADGTPDLSQKTKLTDVKTVAFCGYDTIDVDYPAYVSGKTAIIMDVDASGTVYNAELGTETDAICDPSESGYYSGELYVYKKILEAKQSYVSADPAGSNIQEIKTSEDNGNFSLKATTVVESHTAAVPVLSADSKSFVLKKSESQKINFENLTSNAKIEYSSLDKGIAAVDSNGNVTGIKAGKTDVKISVTQDGKTTSFTIPVTVFTFQVPSTVQMSIGYTKGLGITVPSGSTVTYKSLNPAVASVSSTGIITGKSAGKGIIETSLVRNGKTETYRTSVTVSSIIVPSSVKLIEGNSTGLNIKLPPGATATYISKNSSIASVSAAGVIKAKYAGATSVQAVIRLAAGNTATYTTSVLVVAPYMNVSSKTVSLNKSFSLSVGNRKAGTKLYFKSSNAKVAVVGSSGKVKGVAGGSAVIYTSFVQNSRTYTLTTKVKVRALKISKKKKKLKAKKKYTFRAKKYYLTGKVKWKSSNKKVAVIGKTTGKVKAKKKGKTTITAYIGNYKAKTTLKVY